MSRHHTAGGVAPPSRNGRSWGVVATLIGLLLVIGIGVAAGQAEPVAPQRIINVVLLLSTGDLGDRAFNDNAYAGLQRAQRELGVRFRVVAWKGEDAQYQSVRDMAQERPDLIIAIGTENIPIVRTVAAEYPNQRFAFIDGSVDAPNVTSVVFRELEGDFLAGALSAMLSKSDRFGFLGGADILVIRRIEHGWREGVRYIKPQAQFLSHYASGPGDFSGFGRPDLGFQLATEMYQQGADVVYAAAGGASQGAVQAAQQQGRLVITTGSDLRSFGPSVVATSRTKNVDTAILTLLEELQTGRLQAGTRELDLAQGGVSLAPMDGSGLGPYPPVLVPPNVREQIAQIQRDLVSGKLRVEEYRP